jgi:uncharacterized protein (DUF2062 family)
VKRFLAKLRRLRRSVVRDPLPPEDVAAGWALGVFVGFAIPFGLQLVVSVPLALMMRVSKIGATLGTLVTNPVTIFFIYPAQTWIVNKLLFGGSLSYDSLLDTEWTWTAVRRLGAEVMASYFLGGILLAVLLTPVAYFLARSLARSRRRGNKAVPERAADDRA